MPGRAPAAIVIAGCIATGIGIARMPQVAAVNPAKREGAPGRAAGVVPPRVRFAGIASVPATRGLVHLRFEVTNRGSAPLPYMGYLPQPGAAPPPDFGISPIYSLQYQRDGQWKPHRLGWCGTGTGPVRLEPGKTASFVVSVPPGDWEAMKAGITWYTSEERSQPQVAWSDAVPRARIRTRSAKATRRG